MPASLLRPATALRHRSSRRPDQCTAAAASAWHPHTPSRIPLARKRSTHETNFHETRHRSFRRVRQKRSSAKRRPLQSTGDARAPKLQGPRRARGLTSIPMDETSIRGRGVVGIFFVIFRNFSHLWTQVIMAHSQAWKKPPKATTGRLGASLDS